LFPHLVKAGYEPIPLVRTKDRADEGIYWNIETGEIVADNLEGLTAVIHLAGEGVAKSRWTHEQKDRIRSSRVKGTRLLAETLAGLKEKPEVLICASAVGMYGNRGDETLTEDSPPGSGFLPEVCVEWEQAADPARDVGIRVVHLRIGVILSPYGGALNKMLLPFKLGLGGIVGNGNQYWSWVALDDVLGAITHILKHEKLTGPVNCTAPNPSTNREFTKALGRVLRRPTCLPVPAFAIRMMLGEMGEDLLLASAKVIPRKLEESGYHFKQTEVEAAMRAALKRPEN